MTVSQTVYAGGMDTACGTVAMNLRTLDRRQRREVIAVRADVTGVGNNPARGTDEGRFARAVRSDQREDFAAGNVEGNLMQDAAGAIGDGDGFGSLSIVCLG
ncbi:MAG: hypothetical protein M0C28_34960 [Candidatus Moduliflexus flocculans]|nr:hypothetical protein [Candidatus Moduliflexus flocculans]